MLRRLRSVEGQFVVLVLFGILGLFVSGWYYNSFCSGPHERSQQSDQQQRAADDRGHPVISVVGSLTLQTEQQNQPNRAESEGSNENWPLCGTRLTDVMLVLFTYFLVVVGWLTVKSGERLTHSAERAAIFITVDSQSIGDTVNKLATYDHSSEMPAQSVPMVRFRYRNYGRSPALLKEVSAHMTFCDKPPARLDYTPTVLQYPDRIIAAGETSEDQTCRLDEFTRSGDGLAIKYGHMRVYFYGRVLYDDIFGDPHEHYFFWSFVGQLGTKGAFGPEPVKDYNRNN